MALPDYSYVSYNGFDFPLESETTVQSKPIYDTAGRAVIYVVHTIQIKFIVTTDPITGQTNDKQLNTIRQQLTQPGQQFIFHNKGFGSIDIETGSPGSMYDVVWGPKPQVISWKPVGANIAAEVIWVCEVAIPECGPNTVYRSLNLTINYKLNFRIDSMGYTTRTYSGHVMRALSRNSGGDRTLFESVDKVREDISPPVPYGFKRASQDFVINEAKNRLDFTIVDEELGPTQVLQDSTLECTATHFVRTGQKFLGNQINTIEATYTLISSAYKPQALNNFVDIVQSRLDAGRIASGKGRCLIPLSFSVREDIFGKSAATFSFSWFSPSPLGDNADNTLNNYGQAIYNTCFNNGIWAPIPGTDYNKWVAKLDKAWGVRGYAGLQNLPTDDLIYDACINNNAYPVSLSNTGFPVQLSSGAKPLQTSGFTTDNTITDYKNDIRFIVAPGTATLKPLPPAATTVLQSIQTPPVAGEDPKNPNGSNPPGEGSPPQAGQTGSLVNTMAANPAVDLPDIVQARVTPTVTAIMEGYGIRALFPWSQPFLESIGGVPVIPAGGDFQQGEIANMFGIPIYMAQWQLAYILQIPPTVDIGAPDGL